jgi:acetyl esterase/lipase
VSTTLPVSNDAVDVQQDIPYYDGGPVLDAYLPKNGQTRRPALVMVHGGGWNSGDKAEFAPYAMRAATEQQWAVFDVDYLLSASDVSSWPDELHDIQAAIRFIATNAQNFGVDPQKVVALGESAGANLLALISAEGTANPVRGDPVGDNPTLAVPLRAVGLWSPPVDLADLYSNGGHAPVSCGPDQACDFVWTQGAIAQYMHCDPASCPEAYADASPTTWVSGNTAPSFVVNSTNELVPLGQIVQYVMKLQAAHVEVQFVQLPGTLHGIEYADQVWSQTIGFLGQQLAAPSTTTTTAAPSAAATTVAPVGAPAEPEPESGSSAGARPWLIAGGILAVGALIAFIARQRHPRPSERVGESAQPEVSD